MAESLNGTKISTDVWRDRSAELPKHLRSEPKTSGMDRDRRAR